MRRATVPVAVILIGAGLVILAFFGWQYVGSNVVARHQQREHVESLQRTWESGGAVPDAESDEVPLGEASALVRIPRFGDSYVMPVLEGTTDDVLSEGVGHFEGTAAPGDRGNYALAAHRVTHGQPFHDLPHLQPGDEVVVETRTNVYTYVVDTDPADLEVPYTAGWVLDAFPVNPDGGVGPDPALGDRLITLTTCSELFHTDERTVVFGHLEGGYPKD